ncbi:MAG TPA: hypothetical protein VIL12_05150, partial [Acidimicrobiia bacterium]
MIILVALGAVAWLAFIVGTSVSGRTREGLPKNLSLYQTDDEMESRRLERTMATAVVFSAFLALAIPIYYLGEDARQAGFEEEFDAASVARGEIFFGSIDPVRAFRCDSCHGPLGVGGAAPFVETRSGISVAWSAPSLNDVFFRYTEDEIRFWITFGRANTPMPPWGLAGGGPLGEQSITDLINFIRSIQITQEEALAEIERAVGTEIGKIERGDEIVAEALAAQELDRSILLKSEEMLRIVQPDATEARLVLENAGRGQDTDEDGLSDAAEVELTELTHSLYVVDEEAGTVTGSLAELVTPEEAAALGLELVPVTLDPLDPETREGTRDRTAAITAVGNLEGLARNLKVNVDNFDELLEGVDYGIAFLGESAELRLWDPDFEEVARRSFAGDVEAARRSVGLFNAYCARCHTSGWSAGLPYTVSLGAGGLGPALFDGRENVQFQRPAEG